MYLHEFQSKNILKKNFINVPNSFLLKNKNDIKEAINAIKSENIVLKAQIYSGSRMKNGGIFFIKKKYETIYKYSKNLFGKKIFTNQTGEDGRIVNEILIEEKINFEKGFYLSIYFDNKNENLCFLISLFKGSNIEEIDEKNFIKIQIDQLNELNNYQIRQIFFFLKLEIMYFEDIKIMINKFFEIFIKNNLLLLEINPLVITKNKFICLDAKIEIDDNSFHKNEEIFNLFDPRQENNYEAEAKKHKLNYISLKGNIGCVVNGAGLAMATMDLIKIKGGESLNFLDIGGDADQEKISNAIKIILNNKNTKCIFINIFGGIMRCDIVAESLINIFKEFNVKIPTIIRLVGNMSEKAKKIIDEAKINITVETDLSKAVENIVNLSRK